MGKQQRMILEISVVGLAASASVAIAQPLFEPVDQIGERDRAIAAPQPAEPGIDAIQLSSGGELEPRADQLTSERLPRPQQQVYRGGRTAQPSDPLSRPYEGRTGTVVHVEGEDRCDAAEGEAGRPAACDQVIETRAAEFQRPDPATLSAEQRLLAEQQTRERGSAQTAARRLAMGSADPDSLEEQAIASMVLPEPAVPVEERPAEESLSAEAAAIIQAIVAPPQP